MLHFLGCELVLRHCGQFLFRYNYETMANPWITNGVNAGEENEIPLCFAASKTEIQTLIRDTPPISSAGALLPSRFSVLTFRVRRPSKREKGFEILVIEGISMNFSQQVHLQAFLFYPTADLSTPFSCPEFIGTFNNAPHIGQAASTPNRNWRIAIGGKLEQLGREYVSEIVVTIIRSGQLGTPLKFGAKVVYERV